jgi:hypothetical protein
MTSSGSKQRKRLTGVLACLSLLALTLVGGAPVEAQATTGQHTAYHAAHPLLAYYYAWWEPSKISGAVFTPVQHYPDWVRQLVDDPDLMREHVNQAQSAGIDGFIVNRSGDLNQLLEVVRGSDFRLSLQVDAAAADPASEISAFYTHLGDPNLITYQAQPVLFFWYIRGYNAAYWSDLRGRIDPHHTALWIADGDDFGVLSSDTWDGISPYAIAWSPNPRSQLPAWAAKARAAGPGKLYIPPVSPGCDDHLVGSTCIQDRAGGAYYQATLDGALAANPAWAIVISTYNEWMEATQIEPAVQYGDQYLDMTRAFAETFHAATPP